MPSVGPSSEDLSRLEFAFKVRAYHHNAIWEEQKHFTWFMSILLSAQILALTSDKISATTQAALTLVAAFVGIVIATTGFRAQRREGAYFCNANRLYVAEHNSVFPDTRIPPPPEAANKPLMQLLVCFATGKAGVRDYFQILFLSFALVFVILAFFGAFRLSL